MIIGQDFMRHIGIDNFFSTKKIQWIDRSVKMKPSHHYDMMMVNSLSMKTWRQRNIVQNLYRDVDLSMMFYCFELDKGSKELCTIITPFGKFRYQQLPMGIKVSPDFAQSMTKKILGDLNIDAYMDDVVVWSNTANGLNCTNHCTWTVHELYMNCTWIVHEPCMNCTNC